MTSWLFLILAGFLEIGFTTTMKLSEGFSKPLYTLGFFILAVGSFICLTKATSTIPMGTAYAVWTGIGAFGTAVIGIVFFREPATAYRLIFLATLIASVIGLKFVTAD